jgi:hypothetical protein
MIELHFDSSLVLGLTATLLWGSDNGGAAQYHPPVSVLRLYWLSRGWFSRDWLSLRGALA